MHRRFEIRRNEIPNSVKWNGTRSRCHWVIPERASRYTQIRYFNYRNGIGIWQLFGSLAVANIRRRTCDMGLQTAHTVNIVDNTLYNLMAKLRYFKKAKFHYFKQVVNLSATCFHVELEQFWHAFASCEFFSDSWAFLLSFTLSSVGFWHRSALQCMCVGIDWAVFYVPANKLTGYMGDDF